MEMTRPAAVAGIFYPTTADALAVDVQSFLKGTPLAAAPKAVIAPHAGYIYSGPVAGRGYHTLIPAAGVITRVILLGPSHRVPLLGLAASSADYFETPLGKVRLDRQTTSLALSLPQVALLDQAHALEHSLEVQLPFLQTVLRDFQLLPLVVGDATADEVAEVLDLLWGGDETLIVVSSDLSHYHDYQTAQQMDRRTSDAIEQLNIGQIGPNDACGCRAINGLLLQAKRLGLHCKTIALANSGDTAGSQAQVVGYGAYVFL